MVIPCCSLEPDEDAAKHRRMIGTSSFLERPRRSPQSGDATLGRVPHLLLEVSVSEQRPGLDVESTIPVAVQDDVRFDFADGLDCLVFM